MFKILFFINSLKNIYSIYRTYQRRFHDQKVCRDSKETYRLIINKYEKVNLTKSKHVLNILLTCLKCY